MVQLEFMKFLINAGIGNYDLSRHRYTLYLYIQQKSVDASTLQAEMCENIQMETPIPQEFPPILIETYYLWFHMFIFSEKYQEINISVSF